MTYCIGVQLDDGLVFLSDSRTNAGVDHISTFRKMTVFEHPGERLMVLLSVLPVGMVQTWFSVEKGLWYARSGELMQMDYMDTLRWLRVVGDTIFAAGSLALGWFVIGLKTGWSLQRDA